MKIIFVGFIVILIFGSGIFAQEKFDLSVRQAIYFAGSDTKSLDSAGQKGNYSTPPPSKYYNLKVKASEATSCEGMTCTYNLGVKVWRSTDGKFTENDYKTYGLFYTPDGGFIGNTIFLHSVSSKFQQADFIMPVKMKPGKNEIKFTIDPENKAAETNEDNNRVTITFTVVWDRSREIKRQAVETITEGTVKVVETADALPDLWIGNIDMETPGEATVSVDNLCRGSSSATTLKLDIHQTLARTSGVWKTYTADVPALGPGQSAKVKITTGEQTDNSILTKDHYLVFTVDPDKKIKESHDENNYATRLGKLNTYAEVIGCTP